MNRVSSRQRVALWVALGLGLLTVALVATVVVVGLPAQENVASQETAEPANVKENASAKSGLFDFANYKRLFRKTYSGFLEELTRQKYFLARASRVFITAMKYRYKKTLYYFSLNHLSDATPQELDKMRNRYMEQEAAQAVKLARNSKPVVDQLPVVDNTNPSDDIGANLRELASEHPDEPALKEMSKLVNGDNEPAPAAGKRKKRSATPQSSSSWSNGELRELPMSKLINTGEDFQLDPEVEKKIVTKVTENVNPNYKPYDLVSFGLVDEQEPVKTWEYPRLQPFDYNAFSQKVLNNLGTGLSDALSGPPSSTKWAGSEDGGERGEHKDVASKQKQQEQAVLEDEVFVDLRQSTKCFLPVRSQGFCGSCYAFAMTAIMEWLLCMKTGNLVPLSEQYMIDCGKPYVRNLDGCNGGNRLGSLRFVHNFGVELRSHYPYFMREHQCPYKEDEPLTSTGYLRTKMPNMLLVHEDKMAEYIQYGPMYVVINTDRSFDEYGGGVFGLTCDDNAVSRHAVVLIGHGRENGREYWLIRNSHSLRWGEEGYYKLDKTVGGICDHRGFMYATKNGKELQLEVDVNPDSDRIKIVTAARSNREVAVAAAEAAAAAAYASAAAARNAAVAASTTPAPRVTAAAADVVVEPPVPSKPAQQIVANPSDWENFFFDSRLEPW